MVPRLIESWRLGNSLSAVEDIVEDVEIVPGWAEGSEKVDPVI